MAIIKQAARQTLGQLIGANNPVVTVPDDSQRQYSWTKKEVDVYWSDIEKFKDGRDVGKESSAEYFIGPVVTITAEKMSGRALLDGQQRLTTSTILLAAIRDTLWQTNSPEAKLSANNIQRDYIARKSGRKEPMEYFLVLSLFDRDFFRDYIQTWNENTGECARTEALTRPSHQLIKEAYDNLCNKVQSRLQRFPDDEDRLDYLDSLRECLINGLVFVEIQTPTSSDANEVFETINSRGKDLSTVDLVRNFLMEKSVGPHEKERVNNAWRSLLDDFQRREDIEKFLRHFWVSKHGDVKSHSLYVTIRKNLTEHFDRRPQTYSVGNFSAKLENAASRYADLISQNTGVPDFDAALAEVKVLSADALYPLFLAASEASPYDEMVDLAKAALSYYVRWTVVGTRESTLLEENIFGLAKDLSNGLASLDDAVKQVVGWIPDDDAFYVAFRDASIPKQAQSRYLLSKLEQSMRVAADISDEFALGGNKVHVENIYPAKPDAGLKLEDHDNWVSRLGNLTLLTGRRDRSNSNLPYPEKEPAYDGSSMLVSSRTQVGALWDFGASRWRVEGIVERQERLARIALDVWPSGIGERA
ncbi:DUF262 domain-containing protein [Streptomyces sp. NPDC102384]|uniref:DUF262 domain-containing protein n=1 Tax=Streptomyces sp. NPDC102384 TaxID=3366166 RepID=UPI00382D142D